MTARRGNKVSTLKLLLVDIRVAMSSTLTRCYYDWGWYEGKEQKEVLRCGYLVANEQGEGTRRYVLKRR